MPPIPDEKNSCPIETFSSQTLLLYKQIIFPGFPEPLALQK